MAWTCIVFSKPTSPSPPIPRLPFPLAFVYFTAEVTTCKNCIVRAGYLVQGCLCVIEQGPQGSSLLSGPVCISSTYQIALHTQSPHGAPPAKSFFQTGFCPSSLSLTASLNLPSSKVVLIPNNHRPWNSQTFRDFPLTTITTEGEKKGLYNSGWGNSHQKYFLASHPPVIILTSV